MIRYFLVVLQLFLGLALLPAASGAEACDDDGQVSFVCGPVNPEDLVALPDSPWVVTVNMVDEGHLYLIDRRDGSSHVAFPTNGAESRLDRNRYDDCPGPLDAQFRPHGLDVRTGSAAMHTLHVVGHGTRESVEVFEVDMTGSRPALNWVGCVVAPDGVSLNSVTSVPGGGFVATNFNTGGGELWEWRPGTGWSEVPGSAMNGPNGVVASADGRWLYIGGWSDEALIRLSRGQIPVQKALVNVGFHIDNVRMAPDGSLIVAGQYASQIPAIVSCLNQASCEGVSSRVARVDPDTLQVEQLVDYPSNSRFVFGTVAQQIGDEIWLGGIAGGDRIARFGL